MQPRRTATDRREFLRLLGAGMLGVAGAALLACGPGEPEPATPVARRRPDGPAEEPARVMATPEPTPEPTPRPVPPAGRIERTLLGGSEQATALVVTHSGVEGPRVLVLGGVHGNEPGGWVAAEAIAGWTPAAGSLLVVPRANALATQVLERTLPELGDLNRLYPGDPEHSLPMGRMASAIVGVAAEFDVELVLDLHESWGFYRERTQDGTAFLGQTVTKGSGPFDLGQISTVVEAVNERVTEREQLVLRDRFWFRRREPPVPSGAPFDDELEDAAPRRRRSSSLSLGAYVTGLTPVLIEMGQQRQPVERRAELHQLFVRSVMERLGMT